MEFTELDTITIKRAAQGNSDAFKKLYDHYQGYLWKVIYRTCGTNTNNAQDIMQETFIRIYKSLPRFRFESRFSTWAYTITYNTAISALTGVHNRNNSSAFNDDLLSESSEKSAAKAPGIDLAMETQRVLDSLSAEDRFLLTSREVTGLSYTELAEITHKTEGTLRTTVSRIKDEIKKRFPQLAAEVAAI